MRRTGRKTIAAAVIVLAVVRAFAADMTANVTLYNDIPLAGGSNVVRNATTGFYNFADRLGDGSNQPVLPPGLTMGGYTLRSTSSDRHIQLDLNGGVIAATTGYIEASVGANTMAGNIEIFNAGDILLGDGYIRTWKTGGGSGTRGYIRIGEAHRPVGTVQVAKIESGDNGTAPDGIYVYSSGDVLIRNAAQVAGTIRSIHAVDGDLHVLHAGNFVVGDIVFLNRRSTAPARQYETLFDGNAYGSAISGAFTAGDISAYGDNTSTSTQPSVPGHTTTIRNYSSVWITGGIDTRAHRSNRENAGYGGDISITNIVEDIRVDGTIDARNTSGTYSDGSRHGVLTFQSGGEITLGSLDMRNFRYAVFQSGGETIVVGLITGTDGNPLDGDGEGSLSNAGTALLRLPTGRRIVYFPDENPALNGGAYTLSNLAGDGDGGTLRPWRARGTVFRFF